MAWTLTLPFPRPPKGLHANDRPHWRTKARATADVRNLVVALVRSQNIPTMQRVSVQLVWVVTDRRKRDEDGPEPLAKAIFDAIGSDRGVSARLVPDDSPEFMDKPRPLIEYRPGDTSHFEVVIRDLTHRPADVQAVAERLR